MSVNNSFVPAQLVVRKATAILSAKCVMAARSNRNPQDEFGLVAGQASGTTLTVRLPFKYTTRTGANISTNNSVQRTVPITLSQIGVDVSLSSVDMAYNLQEGLEQVLEPAMSQLGGSLEAIVGQVALQFPTTVGTLSTSVSMSQLQTARQYLQETLAPESQARRSAFLAPAAEAQFAINNANLFNPVEEISGQFLDGVISERIAGAVAFESPRIATMTFGTMGAGSPTVSGAGQGFSGANNTFASTTTLVTSGWASGGTTLTVGTVLNLSGVNAVDPETKANLGRPMNFVVTSQVSDTLGNLSVVISPAIITGGAYQNVSAGPGAAAPITLPGGASLTALSAQSVKQSLMIDRDGILFSSVPLADLSGVVVYSAEADYEGFRLRVAKQWDWTTDQVPVRIDALVGASVGDNALGVRIFHP